jgi:hypothetical protein
MHQQAVKMLVSHTFEVGKGKIHAYQFPQDSQVTSIIARYLRVSLRDNHVPPPPPVVVPIRDDGIVELATNIFIPRHYSMIFENHTRSTCSGYIGGQSA